MGEDTLKPRVAVVGADGMLGQAVMRRFSGKADLTPLLVAQCDLTDRRQVLEVMAAVRPTAILNCAAMTQVDACESQLELAMAVNGDGPANLVAAAREIDAELIHISTDYVFSEGHCRPIPEDGSVGPRSVYGRSKLAGERAILDSGWPRHLIVRTSWLYGLGGRNFVETILRLAGERPQLRIVNDQVGSPTWTDDLADALLLLLVKRCRGVFHFADSGSCSWYEFAREIVRQGRENRLPLLVAEVLPISSAEFSAPAPRPSYSVLSTDKYQRVTGETPPGWQSSLADYFRARTKEKVNR